MKLRTPIAYLSLLLATFSTSTFAQQSTTQPAPPAPNLAIVATPSTSFVSGHESLAVINSGLTPRNSHDHRNGAYGNWPNTGTQWLQYDFPQAISTNASAIYWWDDHQGVRLPKAARLQYWNGSAFIDLPAPGLLPDRFNTVSFPEITTSRLRLEIDSNAASSTGVLQWTVADSGHSPAFAPLLSAGPDRDVVGSGATYLTATLKTINTPSAGVQWSKTAGPGEVRFADAGAPVTSATFSAPGDYTLKLSASAGNSQTVSTLAVHVLPGNTLTRLDPVYTTTYQLHSPLWNSRIKALITHWLPHCIAELNDLNLKEGGINNFIQAGNKLAGKPYTPHISTPWADAYTHNTVESMCVALMVDPQGDADIIAAQEQFRKTLDQWIPIILAAQEPDGYLQTRFTLGTPAELNNHFTPPRWSPRFRGEHEGYTAGYFIESAIAHHIATGGKDDRLYNAAKKLADCWDNNLGPAPKKAWFDGHEEIEQALVRLGRYMNDTEGPGTGDRYIKLAKFLLDCRGGGTSYDQSHLPVTQQYEALGHAVRATYCYSAMTDIAMETHDNDYASAAMSIWDNMVNRKMYVTGGIGSGDTSEGFGRDYALRNDAYCESCANCGEVFFHYKMNLATHDAKFADLYEDAIYNAILGDFDLAGDNFTYTNSLDTDHARYPWHNCPCCVGNFPRTLLEMPTWMYSTDPHALYVNLFLGSTVHVPHVAGTDVEITQTTDYPWKGDVALTVKPTEEKAFAMKIRIPHADVSTLYTTTPALDTQPIAFTVNGESVKPTMDHGYAVIDRTWKAGDKIAFEVPLAPQRIVATDKIAADQHKVALRYGPIVYNIESKDQNVDAVLPPDVPLIAHFDPNLLGGVMTIKSTFADGSPMLAIPNFARANRGGRSLVWINAATPSQASAR